jgi:hypothetical protein
MAFLSVELGFLAPTVKNHLAGVVVRPDGTVDPIAPPRTDFGVAVSPRFDLGYILPDHQGELSVGYRFIVDQATNDTTFEGLDGSTRSRLDVNIFDFDYATTRFEVYRQLELQLRLGARLGSFFYDAQIANDFLGQRATNYFLGAGPHFAVDAYRHIVLIPGLDLFARLDGTVLIGQSKQTFAEQFTAADGTTIAALDSSVRHTQAVPGVLFQAGLSYTPPRLEYLHFAAGYQFERYWDLGHFSSSSLDLTTNGGFLRGQIDF